MLIIFFRIPTQIGISTQDLIYLEVIGRTTNEVVHQVHARIPQMIELFKKKHNILTTIANILNITQHTNYHN